MTAFRELLNRRSQRGCYFPVMQPGQRERSVYLPAGRWRNVDTGDLLIGGQTVVVPAPLDVIPVFERS